MCAGHNETNSRPGIAHDTRHTFVLPNKHIFRRRRAIKDRCDREQKLTARAHRVRCIQSTRIHRHSPGEPILQLLFLQRRHSFLKLSPITNPFVRVPPHARLIVPATRRGQRLSPGLRRRPETYASLRVATKQAPELGPVARLCGPASTHHVRGGLRWTTYRLSPQRSWQSR